LAYTEGSIERGLLRDDPQALGEVTRWIALCLNSPRFWSLRSEWLDLHQEVLARVVESLREERYDPSRDLRAYVQGITRHTAMQALVRWRRARAPLDPGMLTGKPQPDPERHVSLHQMTRWVLDAASTECRELILAYYFDELSYAEIAQSRSLPLGTVKSRLFRCLEAAYLSLVGSVGGENRSGAGLNRRKTEGPA